ncbi:heterokaryon incompatibility protein [Paraphaeosphaeria sporulosa]
MGKAKSQRPNHGGMKLSLGAFLQLNLPAPAITPAASLLPQSLPLPEGQNQPNSAVDSSTIADYVRDNPTPLESHARKAFKGLCFECQMIFATWKHPSGLGIPSHKRNRAHHNFEDLEHCWCPLCRILLSHLLRYNEAALQDLRIPENSRKKSDVKVFHHRRYVPCYYVELSFEFGDRRLKPYFMMFVAGRDSPSTISTVQPSTDCGHVWDLANKWLRECEDSHTECATFHLNKTLPTRLLDVGSNNDELRLVTTESLPARTHYATLSHCWGSKPFFTLTRSNFGDFLESIPFDRLSKTFRDAITAARNLEFQYLWIDSLCIMQQDEKDWQHEASKMSQVYSNSSLNIAAADSADSDVGCFFDDRPNIPNAWKVAFPNAGPVPEAKTEWETKERSRHYIWNCINPRSRALIDDSQLATRAWTLQERLLPPRTLYFGRDQIAWECRLGNAYEAVEDMFDEGIIRISPGNFSRLLQEISPFANVDNVRQWSLLVELYSKRRLSFGRDKLVAISGLARMLAPLYKSNYVAGLWVKDMVRLMAWYKNTQTELVTENGLTPYRAPTWSWASLDGEITYSSAFVEPLEGEYADAEEDLPRPPLAKVLEAVTTYPEDQFGEVTSGFVCLQTQALFRVTIGTRSWVRNEHFQVHIRGIGSVNQFTAYPDHGLDSIEGESLLVPLVDGERDYPYDYPEMRGLFLERVEDGIYRRKGAWRIGGEFSADGLGAEHYKVARMWWAKGAQRSTDRITAGLDQGEFACLWDGEAYIVKII